MWFLSEPIEYLCQTCMEELSVVSAGMRGRQEGHVVKGEGAGEGRGQRRNLAMWNLETRF